MLSEIRTVELAPELRSVDGSKLGAVAGMGIPYATASYPMGGFVERVAPGAVVNDDDDIACLMNHDPSMLLGRTGSGTMVLDWGQDGVRYLTSLPDTDDARDLAALLTRGDISGSSFRFQCLEDEWGLTDQEYPIRTLVRIKLIEMGPCTFPAYPDSSSALRSLAESRSLSESAVNAACAADQLARIINPPRIRRAPRRL